MKFAKIFLIGSLVLGAVFGVMVFWIYGVDSHHQNRDSIWWPERGRNVIPPTAMNIVLNRDLLDHYATYTVAEKDLQAFLLERFESVYKPQHQINPAMDRIPVDNKLIGQQIGPIGWEVADGTNYYGYYASNGGMHSYYHDPATGRTYQRSAYW
jgi:hypothetical protein